MPNRFYNKATGTEIFDNPLVPNHLLYNAGNPDHVALPDTNPYFSALPEGMSLNYDGNNIPTTLSAIPNYEIDKAKGIKIGEIYDQFNTIALADGIDVTYEEVSRDLAMRGAPPSPTSDQTDLYANVTVADEAVAAVNGYVGISDVNNFDASIPSGSGYTGAWN